MKKVKLTTQADQKLGVYFRVFPSVDDLCRWITDQETEPEKFGGFYVHLRTEGYIEAELTGFEYIFGERVHRIERTSLVEVHFAEHSKTPVKTFHEGWITESMFTFKDFDDSQVKCKLLAESESLHDLQKKEDKR